MTQIPDQAVQAAALSLRYSGSATLLEMATTALTAALPYLTDSVEVKELEWIHPHINDNQEVANTEFGTYGIWEISGEYFLKKPENTGGFAVEGGRSEAKAAAQADYRKRILDSLKTKPIDVEAVRRQAYREGVEAAAKFCESHILLLERFNARFIRYSSGLKGWGFRNELRITREYARSIRALPTAPTSEGGE